MVVKSLSIASEVADHVNGFAVVVVVWLRILGHGGHLGT